MEKSFSEIKSFGNKKMLLGLFWEKNEELNRNRIQAKYNLIRYFPHSETLCECMLHVLT